MRVSSRWPHLAVLQGEMGSTESIVVRECEVSPASCPSTNFQLVLCGSIEKWGLDTFTRNIVHVRLLITGPACKSILLACSQTPGQLSNTSPASRTESWHAEPKCLHHLLLLISQCQGNGCYGYLPKLTPLFVSYTQFYT